MVTNSGGPKTVTVREWMDAHGPLPPSFVVRLAQVIDAAHSRGLVFGPEFLTSDVIRVANDENGEPVPTWDAGTMSQFAMAMLRRAGLPDGLAWAVASSVMATPVDPLTGKRTKPTEPARPARAQVVRRKHRWQRK